MDKFIHPVAKKWCEKNGYKPKEGLENFYWDKDLDIGMSILVPVIGTDEMKIETILSVDKEELPNDTVHITCVTLTGRLVIGYYNHNQMSKFIHPNNIFEDKDGNVMICPYYVGYYQNDDNKSLVLWVNGNKYKNDIYSIQRVCFLVQDEEV